MTRLSHASLVNFIESSYMKWKISFDQSEDDSHEYDEMNDDDDKKTKFITEFQFRQRRSIKLIIQMNRRDWWERKQELCSKMEGAACA